jgi:class 3 adenylate cyclase/tetratricopeptide (TPR) repeat protein
MPPHPPPDSPTARTGCAQALAAYVPPLVLAALAREPHPIHEPRAETFDGVILLTDIAGSTTLTERMDAAGPSGVEDLSRILNAYFSDLIDRVEAHGGLVVKLNGDGLIAVWKEHDAPLAELTRRAAQCAITIQEKLGRYRVAGDVHFSMRVSLGAGRVLHFVIGGVAERWASMIDGAALAEARAAIAIAHPGDVMLGEFAAGLLRATAETDPPIHGTARLRSVVLAPLCPSSVTAIDPSAEPAVRLHVAAAVRDRVAAGQTGWLAEFRRVTVIFFNVSDVQAESERGLARAQTVMRTLQTVLARYQGTIDNLGEDQIGLTLVAALGLPGWSHEDDATRAVRIAVAARRELRDLGFHSSIGVTTGRLFCGSIGNPHRRTYSMVGDTINRCARLMKLAENDVLCDEPTRAAAARHIRFEFLHSVTLRGKTHEVMVYRPLEEAPAALRRRSIVGREPERAAIRDRLANLGDGGESGVMILEGEAGLGKSTLIAELHAVAAALSLRTLEGAGDSIERAAGYRAWQRVFAEALGFPPEADSAERCELLLERLLDFPDMFALAPLLNAALDLHLRENELTSGMTAEARATATASTLGALLTSAAAGSPIVVVLDDCQWMDSASWTLALEVHRSVPQLLLFLATRPLAASAPPEWPALVAAAGEHRLVLGPLLGNDALALVCERLGVEALPHAVASLIRERAEGHPFLSEELGYALRDAGLLRIHEHRCELTSEVGDLRRLRLPDTVQGLISERIDRLSPRDRLAIKVASVPGQTFSLETLRAIHPVELDLDELPACLGRLVELEFTTPNSDNGAATFAFKHAIIREVAYEQLLFSQRRELHRRLAEWLEPRDADAHSVLAHHWSSAAMPDRAVAHLGPAGDGALRRFANREAVEFLEQAIRLNEQHQLGASALTLGRWHRQLGEAYYQLGHMDRSRRCLVEATRILGQPMPSQRALKIWALPRAALRQFWHRMDWPSLGRSQGSEAQVREAIRAYNLLGEIAFLANELSTSVFSTIHGLNLAETLAPSPMLAELYGSMMITAAAVPPTALGLHYRELAHRALGADAPPVTHAYIHELTAIHAVGLGQWERVFEELAAAREIFQRFGNVRRLEECLVMEVYALVYQGRFSAAVEPVAEIERSAQRREDAQSRGWARLLCAQAALPTEGPAAALAALGSDESMGVDALTRAAFHATSAAALFRQGEWERARRHAEIALDRLSAVPPVGATMMLYCSYPAEVLLGLLARDRSDRKLATRADRACALADRYARSFPNGRPRAALWRGFQSWLRGWPRVASRHWTRAGRLATGLSMDWDRALATAYLGLVEGDARRTSAREQFARLGATSELAHWPATA